MTEATGATGAPSTSFLRAVGISFEATVRNLRTCLLLVSVYAVLSGVASAIGGALSVETDPVRATPGELVALVVAGLAGFAIFILVYTFVYPPTLGALSLVGSAAVSGDELETHGIVRRVFDRALEVIGAFVLTVLALAVLPIAVGIVAILAGLVAGAAAAVGAMVFAMIVLAIPGVYIFVRLSLAVPVVVREGLGPIQALRRSWDLVAGGWWWVFGVFVAVGVLGGILGNALGTVVSLGQTGLIVAGRQDGNLFLVALGSAVAAAVSGSLLGVANGVVYTVRAQSRPPAELPLPPGPAEQGGAGAAPV